MMKARKHTPLQSCRKKVSKSLKSIRHLFSKCVKEPNVRKAPLASAPAEWRLPGLDLSEISIFKVPLDFQPADEQDDTIEARRLEEEMLRHERQQSAVAFLSQMDDDSRELCEQIVSQLRKDTPSAKWTLQACLPPIPERQESAGYFGNYNSRREIRLGSRAREPSTAPCPSPLHPGSQWRIRVATACDYFADMGAHTHEAEDDVLKEVGFGNQAARSPSVDQQDAAMGKQRRTDSQQSKREYT